LSVVQHSLIAQCSRVQCSVVQCSVVDYSMPQTPRKLCLCIVGTRPVQWLEMLPSWSGTGSDRKLTITMQVQYGISLRKMTVVSLRMTE
jgi:hypothetical protein